MDEDALQPSYSTKIVVVKVVTDSGLIGMGFTGAPPVTGLILQTFIEYLLAPFLIDQDPSDTAMLWQRMYWDGLLRRGGDGLMRNANAAVAFAL